MPSLKDHHKTFPAGSYQNFQSGGHGFDHVQPLHHVHTLWSHTRLHVPSLIVPYQWEHITRGRPSLGLYFFSRPELKNARGSPELGIWFCVYTTYQRLRPPGPCQAFGPLFAPSSYRMKNLLSIFNYLSVLYRFYVSHLILPSIFYILFASFIYYSSLISASKFTEA